MTVLAVTRRPIVLETQASGAMLTDILARMARIRGRTSDWGATDPVRAELLAGYSVEADFINGYFREGFVEGPNTSFLPGWSFSRSGAGAAFNVYGQLVPFATGVPRITDKGLLVENAATNKCTNFNANPTDTTSVGFVDNGTGSSLAVVDDAAELANAGLNALCTSGKVYRIIAGSAGAYAFVGGVSGSTAQFTYSAWVRGGSGYISHGSALAAFGASPTYQRRFLTASGQPAGQTFVAADPNQTVYFILNHLEAGDRPTSPIVTAGAAATRGADDASLTYGMPPEYTLFLEAAWQPVDLPNAVFLEGRNVTGATFITSPDGSRIRLTQRHGLFPADGESLETPAPDSVVRMAVTSHGDLAADGVTIAGAAPQRTDWTTAIQIGARHTGSPSLAAQTFIRRLAIIPRALSATQIESLTA